MARYDKSFRLLGLSGSIRQGSPSTTVLRMPAKRLDDGVWLTMFLLDDAPLYDCDLEAERLPDSVEAFEGAIGQSKGITVYSTEYNHDPSSVLLPALARVTARSKVVISGIMQRFAGIGRVDEHTILLRQAAIDGSTQRALSALATDGLVQ